MRVLIKAIFLCVEPWTIEINPTINNCSVTQFEFLLCNLKHYKS